jgi:hypothetical protein
VLASAFVPLAHADIFTWVDASGTVNVSNLDPPSGVVVTNVVHESPPKPAARDAQVQALAARVRQLEEEADVAKRQAPAPVAYQGAAPPPVEQYAEDWGPPPAQYSYSEAPPASPACDPAWMNCGLWFGPGIYPANVYVLRAPAFRRFHPVRVEHHLSQHPMHPPVAGQHPMHPAVAVQHPMHPAVIAHRG